MAVIIPKFLIKDVFIARKPKGKLLFWSWSMSKKGFGYKYHHKLTPKLACLQMA